MLGQAKVIRLILGLWRDRKDNDSFYRCMVRLGWRPPSVYEEGGFKTVLMKDKLVLKWDDVDLCGHTKKEWTLYHRTTTFKRRFLAKCYAYGGLTDSEFWIGDGTTRIETVTRCSSITTIWDMDGTLGSSAA